MATFKCPKCNLAMRDEARMDKHIDACNWVPDTGPTIWTSASDSQTPSPADKMLK